MVITETETMEKPVGAGAEAAVPERVVIYHANCLDGFAAALCAWRAFGPGGAEYVPAQYGDKFPEVPEGSEVYIVDFSWPAAELAEACERYRPYQVTVMDHHETAEAELERFLRNPVFWGEGDDPEVGITIFFDLEKSGARLAWEYFSGSQHVPPLVRHVEDRDLWRFKLEHTDEVCLGLGALPRTFEAWSAHLWTVSELNAAGENIKAYRDGLVASAARKAIPPKIRLSEHVVPGAMWVNCTAEISQVGDRILKDNPGAAVAAMWFWMGEKGCAVVSLRSREGGFDCGALAAKYGGGGHRCAAGFKASAEWLKLLSGNAAMSGGGRREEAV